MDKEFVNVVDPWGLCTWVRALLGDNQDARTVAPILSQDNTVLKAVTAKLFDPPHGIDDSDLKAQFTKWMETAPSNALVSYFLWFALLYNTFSHRYYIGRELVLFLRRSLL